MNKEKTKLSKKIWRDNNKDKQKIYRKRWALNNKEKILENRNKKRIIVLSYYSKNLECNCCKEKQIEFLSIDHINGYKGKEKRPKNQSGTALYDFIIKNNFPNNFQVLCYNCNLVKGFLGKCPHKK